MKSKMHWLLVAAITMGVTAGFGVGCGNSVEKKNNDENNGANNGKIVIDDGTNNGANNGANNGSSNGANNGDTCGADQILAEVNGVLGCYDQCQSGACDAGFRCVQGICIVDDEPEPEPECTTRADCRADEECQEGECRSHMYCDTAYGDDGSYACTYRWEGCSDGKNYRGRCEEADGSWLCTCEVNDVSVDSFSMADDPCDYGDIPTGHRMFNENCGWVVPEAN